HPPPAPTPPEDVLPLPVRLIGTAESQECDHRFCDRAGVLPRLAVEPSRDQESEERFSDPLHPPVDNRGVLPVEAWVGTQDVPARSEDGPVDFEQIARFRSGVTSHPRPRLIAVDTRAFESNLLQEVGILVIEEVLPESPTPDTLGAV